MRYVTSINEIADFQKELSASTILSVDTETTGLDCFTDFITLLQVKTLSDTYIFDWDKLGYKHTKYITELIQGSGLTCILANAKFDLKFLKVHTGVMLTNVYDTMIAEVLPKQGLTKNKFPSLEELVEKYKGIKLNKEIRKQFYEGDSGITQEMLIYACEDVEYLEEIRSKQLEEIARTRQEKTLDLEMRLLPVVADMEVNGVYLDREEWLDLHNITKESRGISFEALQDKIWQIVLSYSKDRKVLEIFDLLRIPVKTKRDRSMLENITDLSTVKDYFYTKFNINSSAQIYSLLVNLVGATALPSTNAKDLVKLKGQYPLIDDILQYRALQKAVTSFGENYLEHIHPLTGRLHTNLNQHLADTGRFSSSNPNIQNVPRGSMYRRAFKSRVGYRLVCVDFSQQEYRLVGAITGEPAIIKAYQDGKDMHTATAAHVFHVPLEEVTKEQRNKAKSYNFAILYGANKFGLSYALDCSLDEAEEIIESFYAGYPVLKKVKNQIVQKVFEKKYSVTLNGRRRYFENKTLFSDPKELQQYRRKLEKEGFNMSVQGSGSDITKLSLCKLYYENPFGEDFKILLTVHDEILCEVKEELAEQALEFVINSMEAVEQPFLGEIPAKAEGKVSDVWEH